MVTVLSFIEVLEVMVVEKEGEVGIVVVLGDVASAVVPSGLSFVSGSLYRR